MIKTADWLIDIGPEAGPRRAVSDRRRRPARGDRRGQQGLPHREPSSRALLAAGPHAERPSVRPQDPPPGRSWPRSKAAKERGRPPRAEGPLGEVDGRRWHLEGPRRPVRQARPMGRPRSSRRSSTASSRSAASRPWTGPNRADRQGPRPRPRGDPPFLQRPDRPRVGPDPPVRRQAERLPARRPWPAQLNLAPFHEAARPVLSDADRGSPSAEPKGGRPRRWSINCPRPRGTRHRRFRRLPRQGRRLLPEGLRRRGQRGRRGPRRRGRPRLEGHREAGEVEAQGQGDLSRSRIRRHAKSAG